MTTPPLGDIKLPEKFENTEADCDLILGGYMRIWNQLELSVSVLFRKLLDTDITTASIILNAGMNQNTFRDILDALGKHRLNQDDYLALQRFLRRMKGATSIRNKLVHGAWRLMLLLGDQPRVAKQAEWVRFYEPTDPELYHKIYGKKKDQKVQAAHEFKLARITTLAEDVRTLATDISAFEKSIVLLPARIPQPVF